jgi:hypothetical protein
MTPGEDGDDCSKLEPLTVAEWFSVIAATVKMFHSSCPRSPMYQRNLPTKSREPSSVNPLPLAADLLVRDLSINLRSQSFFAVFSASLICSSTFG